MLQKYLKMLLSCQYQIRLSIGQKNDCSIALYLACINARKTLSNISINALKSSILKFVLSFISLLVLTACGGGSSDSDSGQSSSSSSSQSTDDSNNNIQQTYRVEGIVADDPIQGATITITQYETGEVLATTTTDEGGNYSVELDAAIDNYLITATGGRFNGIEFKGELKAICQPGSSQICHLTPLSLLLSEMEPLYSDETLSDRLLKAEQDINEGVGLSISEDPFIKDALGEATGNVDIDAIQAVLGDGEVIDDWVLSMTQDLSDGYLDDDDLRTPFSQARARAFTPTPVIVNLDELEEVVTPDQDASADDNDSVIISRKYNLYSFATESSASLEGEGDSNATISTANYLSDVVAMEVITYDIAAQGDNEASQETENQIRYFSFNLGSWVGELNSETSTLSQLFLRNPQLLFLPNSEKEAIANLAVEDPIFVQAQAAYDASLNNMTKNEGLSQLSTLLTRLANKLTRSLTNNQLVSIQKQYDNKLNTLSVALTNSLKNSSLMAVQDSINFIIPRANASSSSAHLTTLIPGTLYGSAITIGQNKDGSNWDENSNISNKTSLYYAVQKQSDVNSQSWWDAFTKPDVIDANNGSLDIELTSGTYTLFNNDPKYWLDKPQAINWTAGVSLAIEMVTGAGLGSKMVKALDKVEILSDLNTFYNSHIETVKSIVSSTSMVLNFLCELNENSQNSNFKCDGYLEEINSLLTTFGNIQVATEPTDAALLESADAIRQAFGQIRTMRKLSDIKKVLPKLSTSLIHAIPAWATNQVIKQCFTDGDDILKVSERRQWYTSSLANYGLYPGYYQKNEKPISDELYEDVTLTYQGTKFKSYALFLRSGKLELAKQLESGTTRACVNSTLSEYLEISKSIEKLQKLKDTVLKVAQGTALPKQDEMYEIIAVLWEEGIEFSADELRTILISAALGVTPIRAVKAAAKAKKASDMAWDAVTKPSKLNFKVEGIQANGFNYEVDFPPLEQVRYIAIPSGYDEYLLDVESFPEIGIKVYQDSWTENIDGQEYQYEKAVTLSANVSTNNLLLAKGAKFSLENKAAILKVNEESVAAFMNVKDSDIAVTIDWHSYRHTNLESNRFDYSFYRTKSTSFNNDNYFSETIAGNLLDCPQGTWMCIDDSLYDYYKTNGNNPVLNAYMTGEGATTAITQMNFIDFSRIYLKDHKGNYVYHDTPGIYTNSTDLVIGDATYSNALNAYVMADYDASSSNALSHRDTLLEQSGKVLNEEGDVAALVLSLQRSDGYNYWQSMDGQDGLKDAPFQVIIKSTNSYGETSYQGPWSIDLDEGQQGIVYVPEDETGKLFNVKEIYIYDAILTSYVTQSGADVIAILDKLRARKESGVLARPYMLLTPNELAIATNYDVTDSDGDYVADFLDLWPDNINFAFDSDGDGIADAWETDNGLDAFDATDAGLDNDGDSYSNYIEFINTLALQQDDTNITGYDPNTAAPSFDTTQDELINLGSFTLAPGETQVLTLDEEIQVSGRNALNVMTESTPQGATLLLQEVNGSWQLVISANENAQSGSSESLTLSLIDTSSGEAGMGKASLTLNYQTVIDVVPVLSASSGDSQLTLTWQAIENADSYNLYYATQSFENLTDIANYASLEGGTLITDLTGTDYVLSGLTNNTAYYLLLTSLIEASESIPSVEILRTPLAENWDQVLRPLNDTGVIREMNIDGDFEVNCSESEIQQDCHHGRDALAIAGLLNKKGDGNAGFDYTRLNSDGSDYNGSGVYSDEPWSCVMDNVTGLIWEVKTTDNGLHHYDDKFNWYSTNTTTNGGSVGYEDDDGDICYGYDAADSASYCNTEAFIKRINTQGLCGFNDWRLPSIKEQVSLFDFGSSTIDRSYFSNVGNYALSASSNGDTAASVSFSSGTVWGTNKSSFWPILLVR